MDWDTKSHFLLCGPREAAVRAQVTGCCPRGRAARVPGSCFHPGRGSQQGNSRRMLTLSLAFRDLRKGIGLFCTKEFGNPDVVFFITHGFHEAPGTLQTTANKRHLVRLEEPVLRGTTQVTWSHMSGTQEQVPRARVLHLVPWPPCDRAVPVDPPYRHIR